MMLDRFTHLTLILGVVLFVVVLASIRREHIRVEYSVTWLLAATVLIAVSISTNFIESISKLMGITYAPVGLLMLLVGTFILVLFRFSIVISRLKDDNITLTQKIAILEYHLKEQNHD